MRSRLFCRQSDPHALLAGVHSVEACSTRLFSVAHSLGGLTDTGGDPGDPRRADLLERAVLNVLAATDELAACASAIESAVGERLPEPAEDIRWSSGPQEHYPELLQVDLPSIASNAAQPGADPSARVIARCRLQITAVKDRYSTVLPALPWIGADREEFAGKRLTRVRIELESAADALDELSSVEPAVDLTVERTNLAIG